MGETTQTNRLIIEVKRLIDAQKYADALSQAKQATDQIISTNKSFNASARTTTETLKLQVDATRQLTITNKKLADGTIQASFSVRQIGEAARQTADGLRRSQEAAAAFRTQVSGQLGVGVISDQFKELTSTLNLTPAATSKAASAFASLRNAAQRTGATATEIINTFERLKAGETDLAGITARRLTPSLNRLLAVFRSAQTEADKLSQAATRTASAFTQLQARVSGTAGVKVLTDQFRAFAAQTNQTPAQIARVNAAMSQLQRVVEKTALTGPQIFKLFEDIRNGTVRTFTATEQLAQGPLRTLAAGFKQTGEAGNKAAKTMSLSWQTFARAIMVSLVLRAVNSVRQALTQAVTEAAEFQVKITEIRTLSQENQQSSEEWAKQLREVSDAFGIPILNVAEAAYQTLSNQIAKGAEAQQFLVEAARFAQAGVTDLTTSVNLLTGALNSFQLDAAETTRVSAALFKTIELGRIRASDMSDTFGRTGVLANQLGVRIEELGATFSSATRNGIRFNEAQTFVRNVFLKLIKPTDAMLDLLDKWGVASGEAAVATFGWQGILQKLGQELETGGISRIAELFGRVRATTGAIILGRRGAEEFTNDLQQFEDGATNFARAVGLRFESAGARLQKELNKVKNFLIDDFGPKALEAINNLVFALGGAEGVIKKVGIAVQAFFGPLTFIFGAVNDLLGEFAKAAEEPAEAFRAMEIVQLRALTRTTAELRKALRERTRITLQFLAVIRGGFQQLEEFQGDRLEALNDRLKISTKQVLDSARGVIREIEQEARSAQKRADAARKRSVDTQVRFETDQFELQISEADVAQQVKLLQDQIKKKTATLASGTLKFTNEKDIQTALRAFDEIEKRQKQLQQLRINADKEVVRNEEKLNELRKRFDSTREQGVERLRRLQLQQQQAAQAGDPQKAAEVGRRIEATQKQINDRLDASNEAQEEIIKRNEQLRSLDLDRTAILEDQLALVRARKRVDDLIIANGEKQRKIAEATAEKRRVEFQQLQQNFKALIDLDLEKVLEKLGPDATLKQVNQAILDQGQKVLDNRFVQESQNSEQVIRLITQTEQKRVALLKQFRAQQNKEETEARATQAERRRQEVVRSIAEREKEQKSLIETNNRLNVGINKSIRELDNTRQEQVVKAINAARSDLTTDALVELIKQLGNERRKLESQQNQAGIPQRRIDFVQLQVNEVNAAIAIAQRFSKLIPNLVKQLDVSSNLETQRKRLDGIESSFAKVTRQTQPILNLSAAIDKFVASLKSLEDIREIRDRPIPTTGFTTPTPFAQGGVVGGRGNGDTVPALLTPGEFVINKAAAAKFMPQLMAINRKRFNTGGPVASNSSLTVNLGGIHTQPGQDLDPDAVARAVVRAVHKKKLILG